MLFSSFIVTLNLEKNLREYYSVIYKLKIKSNLLKAHTIIFTFFFFIWAQVNILNVKVVNINPTRSFYIRGRIRKRL